jgi:hypothetical protein
MTDEEFYRHTLEVLKRELGADGLARFLRLYRSGSGDYIRDRDQWLGHLTIEDIRKSIADHRHGRERT